MADEADFTTNGSSLHEHGGPMNGKKRPNLTDGEQNSMDIDYPHTKRSKADINGLNYTKDSLPLHNGTPFENHKNHLTELESSIKQMDTVNSRLRSDSNSMTNDKDMSDKPNRTVTSPFPTSRKELIAEAKPSSVANGSEPEIITLSDSEDELKEMMSHPFNFSWSDPKTLKLLKRHQARLRVEESKLILLKKLRLSLARQPTVADLSAKGSVDLRQQQMQAHSSKIAGNIPPPLKRGSHGRQSPSTHSVLQPTNKATSHHSTSQHVHGHHASSKGLSSHQNSAHHHSNNASGSSGASGPPPLVNMVKTSSTPPASRSPLGYSNQSNTPNAASSSSKKAATPQAPQLTAEQKLLAAKTALRKQLEQSLQQISAPKAIPPELNFIPSLSSAEFVCLLGMEEVVKYILSPEQQDVKYVCTPFDCVQCQTDFTPVWKRDQPGSKNVICERCLTSNQKKVLRQEYTAKLKTAFSKSLQKEQDLERRIGAGSPLSDIPGLSAIAASTVVQQQQRDQQHSQQQQLSSASPVMPQLTAQQSSHSSTPSSSANQLTAAQLQQHHAFLQAQAAEQMRAMLAAQAMALPYQLYGIPSKQAADLQRQYLLDMINPNRSWKT